MAEVIACFHVDRTYVAGAGPGATTTELALRQADLPLVSAAHIL